MTWESVLSILGGAALGFIPKLIDIIKVRHTVETESKQQDATIKVNELTLAASLSRQFADDIRKDLDKLQGKMEKIEKELIDEKVEKASIKTELRFVREALDKCLGQK